MIGAPMSRAVVDAQLGSYAKALKIASDNLSVMKQWADGESTEDLMKPESEGGLGYTEEEAGLLKSALGEVSPISDAIDATAFLKQVWGTGVPTPSMGSGTGLA